MASPRTDGSAALGAAAPHHPADWRSYLRGMPAEMAAATLVADKHSLNESGAMTIRMAESGFEIQQKNTQKVSGGEVKRPVSGNLNLFWSLIRERIPKQVRHDAASKEH